MMLLFASTISTNQGDQMSFWKHAQNVAQPMFCQN
jgi:hypothetical protein